MLHNESNKRSCNFLKVLLIVFTTFHVLVTFKPFFNNSLKRGLTANPTITYKIFQCGHTALTLHIDQSSAESVIELLVQCSDPNIPDKVLCLHFLNTRCQFEIPAH